MKQEKKGISTGMRIVLALIAVALIVFAFTRVALVFFGKDATAAVTNVSSRWEREEKGDRRMIITQQYRYTVNGKEYTNSATFTVRLRDAQMTLQKKSAEKSLHIRYLPVLPQYSSVYDEKNSGFWNVALAVLLVAAAVVLFVFAFRKKKVKAKVENAPAAAPNRPNFCPHCGAPVTGNYCGSCGNKIE